MSAVGFRRLAFGGLLVAAAWAAAADAPPLRPRHDPFARPDLSAGGGGAASAAAATAALPRLTAVVVAGPRSMAVLNGQVLELGGELDGFRLIQVGEDKALFQHAGRRVVITLDTGPAR